MQEVAIMPGLVFVDLATKSDVSRSALEIFIVLLHPCWIISMQVFVQLLEYTDVGAGRASNYQ